MSFCAKNTLIIKNLKKYESKIHNTLSNHRAIFFIIFGMYPLSDKCTLVFKILGPIFGFFRKIEKYYFKIISKIIYNSVEV